MTSGASAGGAGTSRASGRRVGLLTALLGVMLAFGGLGAAQPATAAPVNPGSEGVIVDGFGGLHVVTYGATPTITSFNSVDYWSGRDIVRGVALRSADPTTCASFGGYTLDGYGGIHPFGINGKNPPLRPRDGPWWGNTKTDIARDIALVPVNPRNLDSPPAGGFVLDGFGGLHYFTIDPAVQAPVITGAPWWPGYDIARGIIVITDPSLTAGYRGGYVVDAKGGLHPFAVNGNSPESLDAASVSYWPNWNIVSGGTALPGAGVHGGFTLDGFGGLHPFTLGTGPAPDKAQLGGGFYAKGWDIARGISMKQKKACP
jgi:hypothetical protein